MKQNLRFDHLFQQKIHNTVKSMDPEPQQGKNQPQLDPQNVAKLTRSKEFHKWALQQANKVGSVVEESDMFVHHGILNVRVINSLATYKARFYAKLPLLKIPREQYQSSEFFKNLKANQFPYDTKDFINGDYYFYINTMIEEYTTLVPIISRTRDKVPDYGDAEIMMKLNELCPIFCKLVKFSYKNYEYQLITYPDVDFGKRFQEFDWPKEEVEVGKWENLDKPLHYTNFNQDSKNKGTVENALHFSRRLEFKYNANRFAIEQTLVFYVKESYKPASKIMSMLKTYTQEYFYPEGIKFEGLYLLDKQPQDSTLLSCKSKTTSQLLSHLFSRNLLSVRSIYTSTPRNWLPFLFRRVLVNNLKQSISYLIPGDILYTKCSGKLHFALYLGNGRILHTNFNLSIEQQGLHSGKHFRINGIECFVDMRKQNILKLLRLRIGPFPKQQIESEAKQWSNKTVLHENINRSYESMVFQVMAGERFSREGGFTEERLDEFVDKVKMIDL